MVAFKWCSGKNVPILGKKVLVKIDYPPEVSACPYCVARYCCGAYWICNGEAVFRDGNISPNHVKCWSYLPEYRINGRYDGIEWNKPHKEPVMSDWLLIAMGGGYYDIGKYESVLKEFWFPCDDDEYIGVAGRYNIKAWAYIPNAEDDLLLDMDFVTGLGYKRKHEQKA